MLTPMCDSTSTLANTCGPAWKAAAAGSGGPSSGASAGEVPAASDETWPESSLIQPETLSWRAVGCRPAAMRRSRLAPALGSLRRECMLLVLGILQTAPSASRPGEGIAASPPARTHSGKDGRARQQIDASRDLKT